MKAVHRANPKIRIQRVGSVGTPPFSTRDPGLLRFCELNELVLVTCDRRMMYVHIADHIAEGYIFYCMLLIDGRVTTQEIVTDLVLHQATYTVDDFIDTIMTIPM